LWLAPAHFKREKKMPGKTKKKTAETVIETPTETPKAHSKVKAKELVKEKPRETAKEKAKEAPKEKAKETPKVKEVVFICKFCGAKKPLSELIMLRNLYPQVACCRECARNTKILSE
jgi:hypothetical protein